ncbi:MAG TPA: hypothetical protein VNU68_23615 [Verrucomicrobiae bacterium]|nr:hypothetical protein [Verrucomicrobiae bacterium]
MNRILTPLLQLGFCLMLTAALSAQADDKKNDPTGTWTWSMPGRDGQTRQATLKLKLDGDKLTGTMAGRNNSETAIEDAKIKGEDISFKVTRELPNGNKFSTKYAGKLSGDTIKGKAEFERNGEAQSRDWEAKRETAKK